MNINQVTRLKLAVFPSIDTATKVSKTPAEREKGFAHQDSSNGPYVLILAIRRRRNIQAEGRREGVGVGDHIQRGQVCCHVTVSQHARREIYRKLLKLFRRKGPET